MTAAFYEIVVTPDQKFILRWGKAQAGPFADLHEAEEAMRRVIENKVYRYDKTGKPLID